MVNECSTLAKKKKRKEKKAKLLSKLVSAMDTHACRVEEFLGF